MKRRLTSGPGFVAAESCPSCGHTSCTRNTCDTPNCVCNCDLEHSLETEDKLRAELAELQRDNLEIDAETEKLRAELAEAKAANKALNAYAQFVEWRSGTTLEILHPRHRAVRKRREVPMRVNIYAEEMTDRVQIIAKEIDGHAFTGLRFYLALPVTVGGDGQHRSSEGPPVFPPMSGQPAQVAGPFIHRPGDDDSAAVTFWGKRDMRVVLRQALELLDAHYAERGEAFK